jgi:hypothetical protein
MWVKLLSSKANGIRCHLILKKIALYGSNVEQVFVGRVAEPRHFNVDLNPDPAFYFNADPEPALLLFNDHWSTDPPGLNFEFPGLD